MCGYTTIHGAFEGVAHAPESRQEYILADLALAICNQVGQVSRWAQ